MNKLVGTCNRELPFVQQLIQTTQLNESLNQREFALDNKLRLIYKWNEVNGLDTQFNLQFTNSRELLFLAQEARINSLPQPTARQEVKQKILLRRTATRDAFYNQTWQLYIRPLLVWHC